MFQMYKLRTPIVKFSRAFSSANSRNLTKSLNNRTKGAEEEYAKREQKRLIKELRQKLKVEKTKLKEMNR